LYDEARGKPIPPDFERYRRGYLNVAGPDDEPPITAPRGPLAGNYIHGKLPWLMHVLRFAVGDSAFARATRHLFDRWRFRSFTLDEFVAALAEGAGQSLDWWQREWLERRGVPELAWTSTVTRTGAGWSVTVNVGQTGELYHLPLEIGIETERGTRYERVQLNDRSAEFRFTADAEPKSVTLDPRRWLLAKIAAR
jgi:aminopeptidase N